MQSGVPADSFPWLGFFMARNPPQAQSLGGIMLKVLGASLIGLAALTSQASGQCSAWTNAMNIAAGQGDPGAIICETLSDSSMFVFMADSTFELAGFVVDEYGLTELTKWPEDSNGKTTLTDEYGRVCIVGCDGSGGITVLIRTEEFDTFEPAYFTVAYDGTVTLARTCKCTDRTAPAAPPNLPEDGICCEAWCDQYHSCGTQGICQPNNAE